MNPVRLGYESGVPVAVRLAVVVVFIISISLLWLSIS